MNNNFSRPIVFSNNNLKTYKRINKIQKNRIVFLGAANISQIGWCELYTYYKSKQDELMFMSVYFRDLVKYLKLLNRFPSTKYKKSILYNLTVDITTEDILAIMNDNEKTLYNVLISENESIDNLFMGKYYQIEKAEQYKTIRWHLNYGNRIIVGEPDGIADNFVYEFKSTKNVKKMKESAFLQANCYAFMFNKTKIRVQIYDYLNDKLHSYEDQSNENALRAMLNRIENIENGNLPTNLMQYKCKKCCFRETCVYQKMNK